MRQLLFATSLVTSGAVSSVTTEGALGIAQIDGSTGEMTFVNTRIPNIEKDNPYLDQNGKHHLNLVLVRSAANGGNVVLPLYPNHYDVAKGQYQAATTFVATLTVPAPDSEYYDYTIIAVKKGKKFNERNKWTASVRVKSTDTAAVLAQKLADYFNANKDGLGLEVTIGGDDSNELTFTAIRLVKIMRLFLPMTLWVLKLLIPLVVKRLLVMPNISKTLLIRLLPMWVMSILMMMI